MKLGLMGYDLLELALNGENEMVGMMVVDRTELVIANGHLDLVQYLRCYRAGNCSPKNSGFEYLRLEFGLSIPCKPVPW